MGQPSPANPKYLVAVINSSGEKRVVERDLSHDRALQLQRALADKYGNVIVEEQTAGESPLDG